MIGMVHGYGLSGSGSNLWTREVVRALCEAGHDVQLACQELRPERYPFVAAAYEHRPDGTVATLFERDAETPGRCTLHRTELDVLPTYVQPAAHTSGMKQVLDLTDEEAETYVARNARTLRHLVDDAGVTAFHVNHVVMMAQAVERVAQATGVPYAVMPHGSAIEYVVRRSEAVRARAEASLRGAARVLALNREMRQRLRDVFPDLGDLDARTVEVPVGVDVRQFQYAPDDRRGHALRLLRDALRGVPRGKTPAQSERLRDGLAALRARAEAPPDPDALRRLFADTSDYPNRHPDDGVEACLAPLAETEAEVILYVGRLLGHKGVPSLAAALPLILRERPGAHLLLAGSGPLREILEAFVWALAHGDEPLLEALLTHGQALEGEDADPFGSVRPFFDALKTDGAWDDYLAAGRRLTPDRVVFTGYLEHDALGPLYACSDVAVFPSIVAEASPMVVPEAMAAGCFPMGVDYAGMAASLDAPADVLPDDLAPLVRLRPAPEHTVRDIAAQVPRALDLRGRYADAFRDYVVQHLDWRAIAAHFHATLDGMRGA